MALCAISGAGRTPAGVSVEGDVLVFFPQSGRGFRDSSGVGVVPKPVRVTVGAGGTVSVSLYSGLYVMRSISQNGVHDTSFLVPNAASATFGECLDQVSVDVFSQTQLAVLAASGILTYATTSAGLAATPANGFFMVPASPSGFDIFQDVGGVATLRGSLLNFDNVPQADPSDTSPGRLLTVGAFGIGGGSGLDITNWNDATISGAIFDGNGAANAPIATGWFIGTYQRMTSIYGVQIVTGVTGAGTGRTFRRVLEAGVWSAWREFYGQTSLLGTVSQSGGIPTGAVIERGSNANGTYVRFADGTQICQHTVTVGAGGSASGSCFLSAETAWTFPAAFSAAPFISGYRASAATLPYWIIGGATSSTGAIGYLRVMSSVSFAAGIGMSVMATGRWF